MADAGWTSERLERQLRQATESPRPTPAPPPRSGRGRRLRVGLGALLLIGVVGGGALAAERLLEVGDPVRADPGRADAPAGPGEAIRSTTRILPLRAEDPAGGRHGRRGPSPLAAERRACSWDECRAGASGRSSSTRSHGPATRSVLCRRTRARERCGAGLAERTGCPSSAACASSSSEADAPHRRCALDAAARSATRESSASGSSAQRRPPPASSTPPARAAPSSASRPTPAARTQTRGSVRTQVDVRPGRVRPAERPVLTFRSPVPIKRFGAFYKLRTQGPWRHPRCRFKRYYGQAFNAIGRDAAPSQRLEAPLVPSGRERWCAGTFSVRVDLVEGRRSRLVGIGRFTVR